MAKRKRGNQSEERRRSRKEILRARRHERQTREIRLAVAAVVGLLVLVLIAAIIIEYVVRPNQAVATVNESTITLDEWQDRVRYQRAQFIVALEDQLEAFQDIGLVQQFSQQQISLLQQPEVLGELVLEQMIDEELIEQAAAARGIEVSQEEVDELIGEQFNYFGGESPTPTSTPTATIEPTPSLTPIPTEVITDTLPTGTPSLTPTLSPTGTPRPSPTAVSEEAFEEEYSSLVGRYRSLGVSEETFRSAVRAQLFREKLADQLAESEGLTREAEMASVYTLTFENEDAAQEAVEQVEDEEFLEIWNTIRSRPASDPQTDDPQTDEEEEPGATASEVLWQTHEQFEQQFGSRVAEAAFELSIGEASQVLTQTVQTQDAAGEATNQTIYHVIQVSGREVRDLTQAAIDNQQQQLVSDLVNEQRQGGLAQINIDLIWRARVPTQPILDPSFLAPPPTQPAPLPTQPPAATSIPEADS